MNIAETGIAETGQDWAAVDDRRSPHDVGLDVRRGASQDRLDRARRALVARKMETPHTAGRAARGDRELMRRLGDIAKR